jgi:hypothetical protein
LNSKRRLTGFSATASKHNDARNDNKLAHEGELFSIVFRDGMWLRLLLFATAVSLCSKLKMKTSPFLFYEVIRQRVCCSNAEIACGQRRNFLEMGYKPFQ